jgi:hypothetical protein
MSATIESKSDYEDDPRGNQELWQVEIDAAQKELQKWHKQGDRIIKRFLDERGNRNLNQSKLNLFSANVLTQRAMLYGNVPNVAVSRRYADANDDVARVASDILERILNNDIENYGEGFDMALTNGLNDRLLPGIGIARVRYEAEIEETEIEAQIGVNGEVLAEAYVDERKVWEDAAVDYIHWKDFLWSPARVWTEVRWVAFKSYMTKDEVAERFGESAVNQCKFSSPDRGDSVAKIENDPWQKAQVWEIWCKDDRAVYWYTEGANRILDAKEDPLELENFFPCPRPMFANITTNALVPRPDFVFAQDQYNEIDQVTQRINMLQKAVKAVGVYDKASDGVQRMFQEGFENDLIPVDNWALFAEKGGIQGQVAWLPIMDIVNALDKLRDYRKELIELLYSITGMSDLLRGAQRKANMSATEAALQGRYGSIRIQSLQDAFGAFATDLQRLRAEIIAKHFDDQTILERANVRYGYDVQLVPQALQLIRDDFAGYRINIESDQVAMTDYARMQNERGEFLQGLTQFISAATPLASTDPSTMPYLLEMLGWAMSAFRGSSEIEGILDRAIATAKQNLEQRQGGGQQQQPSPDVQKQQMKLQETQMKQQGKMQEIQAKAQADSMKIQQETQADMAKIQAETAAEAQREANQARFNIIEEQEKAAIRQSEKIADIYQP